MKKVSEYLGVAFAIACVHWLFAMMYIQLTNLIMYLSNAQGKYRTSYLISPWIDAFIVAFCTGIVAHFISTNAKIYVFKS